jgi:large subunit ribosomal protein L1
MYCFDERPGQQSVPDSTFGAAALVQVGTLTDDVAAAVREMRRGRLEFKMDRTGNVHAPLGKASFPLEHLHLNLGAFVKGLMAAKPEAIKGGMVKFLGNVTVCSSMGKGLKVEVSSLQAAVDAASEALAEGEKEG